MDQVPPSAQIPKLQSDIQVSTPPPTQIPHRQSHKLIWILTGISAVIALGVGGALYLQLTRQSEKVVGTAIATMVELDTVSMAFSYVGVTKKEVTDIQGDVVFSPSETLNGYKASATISNKQRSGLGDLKAELDLLTVGYEDYMKINSIELPATSADEKQLYQDIFLGRWIQTDLSTLGLALKIENPVELNNLNPSEAISGSVPEYITSLPTNLKQESSDRINGKRILHYHGSLSQENISHLIEDLIGHGSELTGGESLDFIQQLTQLEADIWIDPTTHYIDHVTIQGWDSGNGRGQPKLNLDFAFTDFNAPITLKAPEDSITMLEVFEEALQQQMQKAEAELKKQQQAEKDDMLLPPVFVNTDN